MKFMCAMRGKQKRGSEKRGGDKGGLTQGELYLTFFFRNQPHINRLKSLGCSLYSLTHTHMKQYSFMMQNSYKCLQCLLKQQLLNLPFLVQVTISEKLCCLLIWSVGPKYEKSLPNSRLAELRKQVLQKPLHCAQRERKRNGDKQERRMGDIIITLSPQD